MSKDTMKEGNTQSYAELASDYDSRRFTGKNGKFVLERDKEIILDFLQLVKPKHVLDIPVGTGRTLSYLKSVNCTAVGLDYTEEMLLEAKKVMDVDRHELCQGNASSTGFSDNEFDCLISLRFFHLFKRGERKPFAHEFDRVLQSNGYAIISFTNGWYCGGINWLKRILGFRTVEFVYPWEVKRLFPGWRVIAVRGNYLPRQWMLDQIPIIGSILRRSTRCFPVNRMCREVFYFLQKPNN